MRFITIEWQKHLNLIKYDENEIFRYVILSHTWKAKNEKITYKNFTKNINWKKIDWQKIEFCKKQIVIDNLQYFWINICCINKANNAELNEIINSIFHWYRRAIKCYVYLFDVSINKHRTTFSSIKITWKMIFKKNKWFRRK